MDQIMVYIWLAVVVLSLVGEATTLDMTSIWFSVGGVAAIIAWFIWNTGTGSIILQVLLFVGVSLICLCTLRKTVKKLISRKDTEKTNVSALSGKRTRLLTDVLLDQKGTLKLNDIIWACTSEDGEEISAGQMVEVIKVSGNKLIVSSVKTDNIEETHEDEVVEEPKAKKTTTKKVKDKTKTFKDKDLL